MPKLPQVERRDEAQLVQLLQDAGWQVSLYPDIPREIDFLIRKDGLAYAVELKRAAESRRDRIVPLLSEAVLQAKAHALYFKEARPLAIIASPRLSPLAVNQVLQFSDAYVHDVGIGLFDDHGARVFRAPGLEQLNSFPPDIQQEKRLIPKPKSYPLFSDLCQWMLKVLLAPQIDPQFLCAPRQDLSSASELALAAGVSQMSASRLVHQLHAEGFIDSYARKLQLVRVDDLLEEWQSASRRSYKEIPCRWVIPGHGAKQLHAALRSYSAHQLPEPQKGVFGSKKLPRVCLALFAAAEALGLGFVHGVPPIIYMEHLDSEVLQRLGISSQRAERADVNLRIPMYTESIFRAAVDRDGLPISDGVQIWLDVSNHPARGKEQANHLRHKIFGSLLHG